MKAIFVSSQSGYALACGSTKHNTYKTLHFIFYNQTREPIGESKGLAKIHTRAENVAGHGEHAQQSGDEPTTETV